MSVPLCSMIDVGAKARFCISMMLGRDQSFRDTNYSTISRIALPDSVLRLVSEKNAEVECRGGHRTIMLLGRSAFWLPLDI